MKKNLVIGLILMAAAALAAAQSDGLYIGGSYGRAYVDTKFSDLEGGHFTLKGDDNAWRGFTGFKFGLIGVEAGYRNLGSVEDSHNNVVFSTKARGYDAFATLNLGVGPVNFFGKAGYLFWNEDIHDILDHTSATGADPAWGVGVSFNIEHIGIRAEWEEFKLDHIDHLSMASVGIAFTF